ncbi:MAG TPA: glutamyl-tRNA reductase [Burkholderiales bacterium]|jgi:glutamyl-tRNA reductase|nr:glutamyl-tRNA reductase [Burkholderiales bacterium]
MRLLALGINHQTAPLELRERAVFNPDQLAGALHDVKERGIAGEATILSTCNRTELYCRTENDNGSDIVEWLCRYRQLSVEEIRGSLYTYPDQEAVKHAFRVAAGLDSMVLGEPQILGQMKEAFATAHKAGVTGKLLNRLFQQTFAVAKQVRTDTAIGASPVSVASASVLLARRLYSDLARQTVLLIGAGDTIELCARHLKEHGIGHLIVANRTMERARLLADQIGAEAISLAEMPTRLADADIVISSTASQLPILGKGAVESALKARRHRPMLLVDLAVPRDVEAEVAEIEDIYLYAIDDLKDIVQESVQSRVAAAHEAEKIIDTRVVDFMRWLKALDAVPTIRALRESADAIREAELRRAHQKLARGEDPARVLDQLARALTNKFTHAPSDTLRRADHDGNDELAAAARRLFNLDDE